MPKLKTENLCDYLTEIPKEIRVALRAISDDTRLAILTTLIKKGEMSFSQLLQRTALTSSTLTHHLRSLIEAGILENFYDKKEGMDDYSFYDITPFGMALVSNIIHSLDVTPKIQDAIGLAFGASYPKTKDATASISDFGDINGNLIGQPYMRQSVEPPKSARYNFLIINPIINIETGNQPFENPYTQFKDLFSQLAYSYLLESTKGVKKNWR